MWCWRYRRSGGCSGCFDSAVARTTTPSRPSSSSWWICAHERAGLGDLLKRVAGTATVVMAEHDVHVVRSVATRVTGFAEGKKIAEGSSDEVFDSADVKRVFLRGRRDA